MGDWDWVVGTPQDRIDEPRWFRDELEGRVQAALSRSGAQRVDVERTAVAPEYLLGSNPSQLRDIVLVDAASGAKERVGFEGLTGDGELPGYRGVIQLPARLPALLVRPRRLRALAALKGAEAEPAPRALSGLAEVDAFFALFTRAPGLPRALLRHEAFARALAAGAGWAPRLAIEPTSYGGAAGVELVVELPDARSPEAVAAGMTLVRALRDAALACADAPDVLATADATRSLAADGDVEGLLGAIVGATSWLSGDVARVGDGVEARLVLDAGVAGATHERRASLSAQLTGAGAVRLRLRAELADDATPFALTPQRGWRAALARIAELKIGDAAVDDAYVIQAATTAAALLRARRLELLRLAEHGASIACAAGALEVDAPEVPASPVEVADAAAAALALWRGVAGQAAPALEGGA